MLRRLLCLGLVLVAGLAFADEDESKLNKGTFSGMSLRGIGPALMSGRIADVVIDPTDRSIWYVAVGSGGVWKTTNRGVTWSSIFDGQGSYSIGCLALDPNDPHTLYVGTGENVGGRHVGYGDGLYRSRDGGKSWENIGLEESEHIGSIRIDPRDSSVIYVASQGPLWSPGGERGLYKSVDGGANWEKILGEGDYVGVNEVHLHPTNPDILLASTHERYRNVAALINGGPGSGIHKSTDGGATWRQVKSGLPGEDMGKIGLAYSPIDPDIVYATIELAHRDGGFYRSADGGESWEKRNDYISGGTGPHYYQEIFASPHHFDTVYQMDASARYTTDGGTTFQRMNGTHKHGDDHAMAFDPDDPDYLMVGSDGGLYESFDGGANWRYFANLPVTQFYKVAVDYDEPFYHVIGGTQDNNTQYGPSRTDNRHGIRNSDWRITLFGDGHQPAIDPTNPDIIYSEWQQGNLVRYDRVTAEVTYIKPQPAADEPTDRFNWDAPILISSHDAARLYFAGQRVWRSENHGDSWTPISGDLTTGNDKFLQPMMGRVQSFDAIWDTYAMSMYATITSLGESPLDENLLYVGTDDGIIQVTEDGGANWKKITSLPDIEDGWFVNDIKADLHDRDTVYVVVDQHKNGDFEPYIFKSTNRGGSWDAMSGDLPERSVVWRIVQDHEKPELFFAGTEFGVFFTLDGGEKWIEISGGPTISYRDLAIQRRENDLVGATFGRGFWILDDYSPLREISEEILEDDAALFGVRDAQWYVQKGTLGFSEKASQGASFFTAPNPDFGASFTYYLRDALTTKEERRQKAEKKSIEDDEDTPYPGWDELREEELEDEPAVILVVRNSDDEVVRRVAGATSAGIHRTSWDLRKPSSSAWRGSGGGGGFFGDAGPLVEPGRYSVELMRRVEGKYESLSARQEFDVVPLRERGKKGASLAEVTAFKDEYAEFNRRFDGTAALLDEMNHRLEGARAAIARSTTGDHGLDETAAALEREVEQLRETMEGNARRDMANDNGPMAIGDRSGYVFIGIFQSTYGPTPTIRMSLDIAQKQLAEVIAAAERIRGTELPALERALEEAGVPWTPGRPAPTLR